eukprot:ANDGO_04002.mRNA.1 hypothetical protein GUITHDRAFT_164584
MNKEFLIHQRRRLESQRAFYASAAQHDAQLTTQAQWAQTSLSHAQHAESVRRASAMREAHLQSLDAKRDRLSVLLATEHNGYLSELASKLETPAQHRDRLKARALELKSAREARQAAYVEGVRDKLFREKNEDIRALEKRQIALEVAAGRALQLGERVQQREEEEREEQEYWIANMRKADEHAKMLDAAIAAQKKAFEAYVKEQLDAQVAALRDRRHRDAGMDAAEFAEMSRKWADASAREAAQREEDVQKRAMIRRLAGQEMAAREHVKNVNAAKEREMDQRFLSDALRREEADRQRELAYKESLKADAVLYQKALAEQMIKEASDEADLEALRKAQNEAEWAKKEAVWNRDAQLRQRLMEEVDRERKVQISEKQAEARAQQEYQERERIRVEEEAAAYAALERAKAEEKIRIQGVLRQELGKQVRDKESARRMAAYLEEVEKEAERRAQKAFDEKLRSEVERLRQQEQAWKPLVRKAQAGQNPFQ